MEISGYATVKNAAKLIGLTNKRVYQLILEGKLEAVKLSREYLVTIKSVNKYLRDRNGTRRLNKKPQKK